ncbi:hypothetical protein LPJ79_003907 [Coemansia sp. RSA 1821]|nr:hypothetical protein LPJ68_003370 [Coemansia sp. RSA 1086]KAJ1749196.1 hypothetical protein LPJ79_003907 [Coemansia sp. RSA 1821]
MSETKQLQARFYIGKWSFPPIALAQEIIRRYNQGNAELNRFIEHYSKRAQLEDSLVTAIEKSMGSLKFGLPRSTSSTRSTSMPRTNTNMSELVPILQNEVEAQARLHLHLAERINNEVVRPLEAFFGSKAWTKALEIQRRVSEMAEEMRTYHEQIPKLSARVAAKAQRPMQLQQRLEDEKQKLFELQQSWQTDIAGMVGDFEAADIARNEVIRESVLKFQHYQNELCKAIQAQLAIAKDAAKQTKPDERVIDVLARSGSTAEGERGTHLSDAEDKASKGFLKLGMFRSKTRRVKKKSSAASQSAASEASHPAYSHTSADISSTGVPSVHTVLSRDPERPLAEPSSAVTAPCTLDRHGNSFVSSSSVPHSEGMENTARPVELGQQNSSGQGSSDFAEWVFAGHSQGNPEAKNASGPSADSLVHVTHSLSAIEESRLSKTEPDQQPADTPPLQKAITDFGPQATGSDKQQKSNGELRFEDVFKVPERLDELKPAESAASPIRPSIDLDSAFAVPPAAATAQPADSTPRAALQVIQPSLSSKSPQPMPDNMHRRNASMEAKGSPQFDGQKNEASDDEAEMEQTFRVNFSIRDRAIQDNPDETKAALTRVTTMLRSAPSSRRRNRREVRTMYVAAGDALPGIDDTEEHPKPKETAIKDEAELAEQAKETAQDTPAAESNNVDVTTEPESKPQMAIEADNADDTTQSALQTAGEPIIQDEPAVEPNTANAAAEPAGDKPETASDKDTNDDVKPESKPDADVPPQNPDSEGSAQQSSKPEGLARRRAPPPPPPPGQSVSRAAKQASQGSSSSNSTDVDVKDGAAARGRRVVTAGQPLGLSVHVGETLDIDVESRGGQLPLVQFTTTGEVAVHVSRSVKPLELAPLRISVKRDANVQWVANPAAVVLDTSLTASDGDREWYRFVRPDLFTQTKDARVAVFKYRMTGQNDIRMVPLIIREVTRCVDETCSMMLFCEPNADSVFAGATVRSIAVLLNVEGSLQTQASRPAATWFRERNRLLWALNEIPIPRRGEMSEDELLQLSSTLVAKMTGTGVRPGSLALRFEVHGASVANMPITVTRVAGGSLDTVPIVDTPAARVVRSGKCIYTFYRPSEDADTNADTNADVAAEHSSSEAWSSAEE